jgi:hypothetical protein
MSTIQGHVHPNYPMSVNSSSYSPNFDNFWNIPDMDCQFATFAFSDSQPLRERDRVRLSANLGPGSRLVSGETHSNLLTPSNEDIRLPELSHNNPQFGQVIVPQSEEVGGSRIMTAGALILTDNKKASLKAYFRQNIRPPASLFLVDSLGWSRMQQYFFRMASSHVVVMDALLSLSQLFSIHQSKNGPVSSSEWRLAFELQQKACENLRSQLDSGQTDEKTQNALLAAVFLLAWFEVSNEIYEISFHDV